MRFCLSPLHILIYEPCFHSLYYYCSFRQSTLYQTVPVDSMKLGVAEQERESLIRT
jgi:hypothetical protein